MSLMSKKNELPLFKTYFKARFFSLLLKFYQSLRARKGQYSKYLILR